MNRTQTVRKLRKSGMSVDNICRVVDFNRHEISKICRLMGMPLSAEEKAASKRKQAKDFAHTDEWVQNYIVKQSGGRLEYVSGYINMDSHLIVRCTHCGTYQERAMISFRSNTYVRCSVCHFDERVEARRVKRQRDRENKIREKETTKLVKAGRGKQLSFGFCDCGEVLSRFDGYKGKRCSTCSKRMQNKYKEIIRRCKISKAIVDNDITLQKLYSRDDGVCHICCGSCDWNDKMTRNDGTIVCGNMYPSIDHVKPLAKGGLHSWDNVKLAHRICNSLKADDYDEEDLEEPNS